MSLETSAIEDLRKKITKGEVSKEEAFAMLTGISESFLQICNSAELIRSRLNQQTIQTYVRQYSQWSRTDILTFVNDAKNQGELKKKPALVLAFYDLLDSQLL